MLNFVEQCDSDLVVQSRVFARVNQSPFWYDSCGVRILDVNLGDEAEEDGAMDSHRKGKWAVLKTSVRRVSALITGLFDIHAIWDRIIIILSQALSLFDAVFLYV